jgi:small subunit ribosomal protein S17
MKIFTGRVVSKKLPLTATVVVEHMTIHPLYKKRLIRQKRYHVHDEVDVKVGNLVRFVETKPYSKTKRWKITEVVDEEKEKKKSKEKGKKK